MKDSTSLDERREQEFLGLFAAAQRPLHAYIVAWVFDVNVAADLLQETNIVLWQKFDQYQSGTNFLAWAREVARRTLLRYRQLNSNVLSMLPPEILESLATESSELRTSERQSQEREALEKCLQKLSEKDRLLVTARYAPGASVIGIAEKLNRTVNSVSQSLRRIRQALAECTQRTLNAEDHLI